MKALSMILIFIGSFAAQANECGRETQAVVKGLSIDYLMAATAGKQVRNVPVGKCWDIGSHRLEKFEGDCSLAFEYYLTKTDRFSCFQSTEATSEFILFGRKESVDYNSCYFCEPN